MKKDYKDKMVGMESYNDCMAQLSDIETKQFILKCLENGKVNQSYLWLTSLVKDGYVDKILTANFDDLLIKALAYENIFPGIYDMAVLREYNPKKTSERAVFYLHGQKDGYYLLNTLEEVSKHTPNLSPLFDDILSNYTLIVIGYSGKNDKLLDCLQNDTYPHGLYWIASKDDPPSEEVSTKILQPGKNSFFMNKCNADEFFDNVNRFLGLSSPRILYSPFSLIDEITKQFANATTSDGQELWMTEFVKPLMEEYCIPVFEGGIDPIKLFEEKKSEFEYLRKRLDALNKLAIKDEAAIELFKEVMEMGNSSDQDTKRYGVALYHFAVISSLNMEMEKACDYYEKAEAYFQHDAKFNYNFGNVLVAQSRIADQAKKENQLLHAEKKYVIAAKFEPTNSKIWANWGDVYMELKEIKPKSESCKYFKFAIKKFERANEILESVVITFKLAYCYLRLACFERDTRRLEYIKKSVSYISKYDEGIIVEHKYYSTFCYALLLQKIISPDVDSKVVSEIISKGVEIKRDEGLFFMSCINLLEGDIETARMQYSECKEKGYFIDYYIINESEALKNFFAEQDKTFNNNF
ncbi:MAG: SIR2 family protein [Ignavibacteriales bacterium]|nr:SIR2 family protein [Ignavibacteriales bacterium]